MSYIVVDVEADGRVPGRNSMVCFGAVLVSDMTKTFYGKTKPISDEYENECLSVSGFNRETHLEFDDPKKVMSDFKKWIETHSNGKHVFISDNPAMDWQWIHYYFHIFLNENPFGHSARRIGDLYCGMRMHAGKNGDWKRKYRKTRHTHNPVDDAMGNAEALHAMKDMGLHIIF